MIQGGRPHRLEVGVIQRVFTDKNQPELEPSTEQQEQDGQGDEPLNGALAGFGGRRIRNAGCSLLPQ